MGACGPSVAGAGAAVYVSRQVVSAEVLLSLGRPPTSNRLLAGHWSQVNRVLRDWREAAGWLWRQQLGGAVLQTPVVVVAQALHADRRSPQDPDGCAPAVKSGAGRVGGRRGAARRRGECGCRPSATGRRTGAGGLDGLTVSAATAGAAPPRVVGGGCAPAGCCSPASSRRAKTPFFS